MSLLHIKGNAFIKNFYGTDLTIMKGYGYYKFNCFDRPFGIPHIMA